MYQVPAGFYYWGQNTDTSKQGVTQRPAGQVLNSWWGIVDAGVSAAETAYSTFDSTGAGFDPTQQTLSQGKATDIYETWYAPSVEGPLMSGVMAAQTGGQVAQGIDRTQNTPIISVPWMQQTININTVNPQVIY
jgi:hypothetical protein